MKKFTFPRGIHPLHAQHEGKAATAGKAIREFVSDSVCIPMDMHLGAPSKPIVKKGDHVKIGQMIGEAVGPRGVPVHASISGEVSSVELIQQLRKTASMCVTIQNDFTDEWVEHEGLGNVETAPPEKIIEAIRDAGIVGMGGASFPTHAKLTLPPGKTADTILVNGAECETFLTSDHRLMLEMPLRVVDGLRAAMRAVGVSRGIIAIEDNKMDAVAAMEKAVVGRPGVEVAVMQTKYPQGGEKQLIQSVLGREVPSGGLPMDVHVVVINAATAAAIADAVIDGKPSINRVVTVTGAVKEPGNLLLRVGTCFSDAITGCGGYAQTPGKIVAGGSMTGIAAPNENVAVTKATNGILVMNEADAKSHQEQPCIRCGRCTHACPVGLMPARLNQLYLLSDYDKLIEEHMMDCILCGACSYVCPARRWLVASFQNAKDDIARRTNV